MSLFNSNEEYKIKQLQSSLAQKAKQQWVDVTQPPHNAKGDGVTNDTTAIKSAVSFATQNNKKLFLPEGYTFLIDTFGDLLDDGNYAAIKLTGNLAIIGNGCIKSNTTQVNNSLFGIDSTSGNITFEMNNVEFSGSSRYRAIYTTANSNVKKIKVKNNVTSRQSMLLIGSITKSIEVDNNIIGIDIESTTNVSPTFNVSLPVSNAMTVNYRVSNNVVRTGTEVITSGAYVIHGMPPGGECVGNTHYNVGMVANEGFDIDNLGKFSKFCRNTSYGAGFEYKVGTEGYSDSRDIIFNENISYNSVSVAFAIQSSCIGFGNIAYNPAGWGLYMYQTTDVDGLLDKSHLELNGFRIIYAGANWSGAVRLSGGFKSVKIENLKIELDPLWNSNNPSTPIGGGTLITITGDLNNLILRNVFMARSQFDMINFRPTASADNIVLENIHFDESCGDSCIDLANCNNVKIINPKFPPTITDRPIRLSTCNVVKIACDYHSSITLAQTSGTNTGVLINNWGQEASSAGTPPTADSKWAIGCIVTNTSDNTVWIRVSASTSPSTAWKQIA
jgi:hypothetical protein